MNKSQKAKRKEEEICNCDYFLSANSKRAHEPSCEFVDYELGHPQAELTQCGACHAMKNNLNNVGICKRCEKEAKEEMEKDLQAEEQCKYWGHCKAKNNQDYFDHTHTNICICRSSPPPREERDWDTRIRLIVWAYQNGKSDCLENDIRSLLNSQLQEVREKVKELKYRETYASNSQYWNNTINTVLQVLDEMEGGGK